MLIEATSHLLASMDYFFFFFTFYTFVYVLSGVNGGCDSVNDDVDVMLLLSK